MLRFSFDYGIMFKTYVSDILFQFGWDFVRFGSQNVS